MNAYRRRDPDAVGGGDDGSRGLLVALGVLLFVLLIGVLIWMAVDDNGDDDLVADDPAIVEDNGIVNEGEEGDVGISDITSNPTQYAGQEVTLMGQIESTEQSGRFLLEETDFAEGDDLYVFMPAADIVLEEGDEVRVMGTVRIVDPALREDIGDQIFDDFELDEIEGEEVVYATSVVVVDEDTI